MKFDEALSKETGLAALRKWYVFVLIEVVAIALAFITLANLERDYAVTATVIGTRYTSDITPGKQQSLLPSSILLGTSTNSLPPITDFRLYMEFLTSPELAATLLDDDLLHRLLYKQWHDGHWGPPDTLLQHIKSLVYGLAGLPAWQPPNALSVAHALARVLKIEPARDTQLLTITYVGRDAGLGKELILAVHHRADGLVKEMARRRLEDKVGFLNKEIDRTSQQLERGVLAATLAKAQIDRLYSQSDLPFAAEFATPPTAAPYPVSPNVPLVLGLFVLAGLLIYFAFILFWVEARLPQRGRARPVPREPEISRARSPREG